MIALSDSNIGITESQDCVLCSMDAVSLVWDR